MFPHSTLNKLTSRVKIPATTPAIENCPRCFQCPVHRSPPVILSPRRASSSSPERSRSRLSPYIRPSLAVSGTWGSGRPGALTEAARRAPGSTVGAQWALETLWTSARAGVPSAATRTSARTSGRSTERAIARTPRIYGSSFVRRSFRPPEARSRRLTIWTSRARAVSVER